MPESPISQAGLVDKLAALHRDMDHLMQESAPLLWERAPELCTRTGQGEVDCTAYHQIWQYLLLWRLSTSIRPDAEFMTGALMESAAAGGRDTLICGTADYAMLAHLYAGFELAGVEPAVTVFDRCATSVYINEWYAQRCGRTISTARGDVLADNLAATGFDIICTHSFLIWFDQAQQAQIVRRWYELLRPKGRLVTSLRLRSGDSEGIARIGPAEIRVFLERIQAAALRECNIAKPPVERMTSTALEYITHRRRRYATGDAPAIRRLFESTGFELQTFAICQETDDDRPSGQGGASHGRLHIVASRP